LETLSQEIEDQFRQWNPIGPASHSLFRRRAKLVARLDSRGHLLPLEEGRCTRVASGGAESKHCSARSAERASWPRRRRKQATEREDGCPEARTSLASADDDLRKPIWNPVGLPPDPGEGRLFDEVKDEPNL
jgi:hypothetical protein